MALNAALKPRGQLFEGRISVTFVFVKGMIAVSRFTMVVHCRSLGKSRITSANYGSCS